MREIRDAIRVILTGEPGRLQRMGSQWNLQLQGECWTLSAFTLIFLSIASMSAAKDVKLHERN